LLRAQEKATAANDVPEMAIQKIWSMRRLSKRQIAGRLAFGAIIAAALLIGAISVWNALTLLNKPFPGFLLNQRMVVGYIGQYNWTGTQAGLRNPDKILKANDRSVSSTKELQEVIRSAGVGHPVKYAVERDGKIITRNVSVMLFTAVDLLMTFGILFFLGSVYLIIGITVFILKPDIKVSWVFFTACFLLAVSNFVSFDIESTHFGFVRAYLFDDVFLPAVVLHFSLLFPEKSRLVRDRPYLEVLPYIVSAVLLVPVEAFYPEPLFVHFYQIALLYLIIGVVALTVSTLSAFFRTSSVLARQRAKVILLGSLLALPIPASGPFLAIFGWTFGGVKIITNFSAIPMVIFPASIAYAIAKHNLFDVDVYVKRAVGYGIMTVAVGVTYFAIEIIARAALTPALGDNAGKVFPIIFAVMIVFLFNPINRRVQEIVDKLFYRKKFDYKDTVLSVSNALTSVLNIDEIMKRIIDTLRTEMFIDRAGVILLQPQRECRALFIAERTERKEDEIVEQCLPSDDPLVSLVSTEKKLITKYDIDEAPRYSSVRESCGERFSGMQASVAIPLVYKNNVTGILALGYKKSGHFYSREDIHLLETLANQGAIAIENAKMAEQMKKEETVRTNLSRYLSPQIVDSIVKENVRVNLGGDRKVVTVLFSDIRNFTSITESRPADQLVRILNEYFTEMAGIIFANQGSLDKYIGDAIVAVFGSLIATENPAQNAVTTAVEMMKRMPQLNEKWLKEYGFSMSMGVGINTGEVFLGNIGSPERMEFTVIGDTVNVASRFSGLARAGQILVTRETRDVLGPEIQCVELPPAQVKGKAEKMEVFDIVY
jgi:class 3 adenylate cyclase